MLVGCGVPHSICYVVLWLSIYPLRQSSGAFVTRLSAKPMSSDTLLEHVTRYWQIKQALSCLSLEVVRVFLVLASQTCLAHLWPFVFKVRSSIITPKLLAVELGFW